MTLTEFLLARIAEDEAVARSVGLPPNWRTRKITEDWRDYERFEVICDPWPGAHHDGLVVREDDGGLERSLVEFIARNQPARVLGECEAKRQIVEWASDGEGEFHWDTVLAPLAAVYSEHPDYRDEWRP